jgi:uncharacterized protein
VKPTLASLRQAAISSTLFAPTTLKRAVKRLGFVQADPIRAPARAQDLTLRHRVVKYRAGDLEAKYKQLGIEEDFFINYGFLPCDVAALMHPRTVEVGNPARVRLIRQHQSKVMPFIAERKEVHPREVDAHFEGGRVTNAWGGSSNLTTQLLDSMHYRGLLRVVRRENGIRVYGQPTRVDAERTEAEIAQVLSQLVELVVGLYAPVPQASLSSLLGRLRLAVPQWREHLPAAIKAAKAWLQQVTVDGAVWFAPKAFRLNDSQPQDDCVRLLAPFDPLVWDRKRFELFWGWAYRFEAYTPAAKRRLGYYALPLLWRDDVIGWANASVEDGALRVTPGYVRGKPPTERSFRRCLDEEIVRLEAFLSGE